MPSMRGISATRAWGYKQEHRLILSEEDCLNERLRTDEAFRSFWLHCSAEIRCVILG